MNIFADNTISLEARGALAYVLAARIETISAQTLQETGCGRDKAYRILGELVGAGCLIRTKLGFRVTGFPSLLQLSPGEEIKSYGFSENPSILRILPEQELLETRNSSAQELLETRNSCTHPTTYMYESKEQDQTVVEIDGKPVTLAGVKEQLTLDGCPDPLTPSSAAPPLLAELDRPKRQRKPPAPAEVKALYDSMFDLTKTVRSGKAAMGVYTKCAALWREFQATPEQVSAFWDWFKVFSRAGQIAAKERRPLNPPLPKQVHECWPQFLEWWSAKQAAAAREAERRATEQTPPPADDQPRLSGRELYRRTFGLPRPGQVLTAD